MNNAIQYKIDEKAFNQQHRQQLGLAVDQVLNNIPNGSTVEGTINRELHIYTAFIQIKSKAGHFMAKVKAQHPLELISKIKNKLLRQSTNWKEKRFSKNRYQRRRNLKVVDEI